MKIFVASTGRCGTSFMTQVFGRLTDFPSFHEPLPKGKGCLLQEINDDMSYSSETVNTLKDKIDCIRGNAVNGNYFESNNYFMRTFVYAVLDAFDDVYCIYLHRNLVDLLASFAVRYVQQGEKRRHLEPTWENNILKATGEMTYFEKMAWNYFEIRERFYSLQDRFVKTYNFDFKYINNVDEWYKMFDHFGINAKRIEKFPVEWKRNTSTMFGSLTEAVEIIRSV